ncbi:MAG: DUF86 domain-containing protein [Rhodoglobus sp.]
MTPDERISAALDDLESSLDLAAGLVARGREAFDKDPAVALAFEALSSRIGEMSKRLVSLDPMRFSDEIWSLAARNRDFVIHHYNKVDRDVLWNSATTSFPDLLGVVRRMKAV